MAIREFDGIRHQELMEEGAQIRRVFSALDRGDVAVIQESAPFLPRLEEIIGHTLLEHCALNGSVRQLANIGELGLQGRLGGVERVLHVAISTGRLQVIKAVVEKILPNVNIPDETGKYPIFTAIDYDDVEALKCLIDSNADFKSERRVGGSIITPLLYCVKRGSIGCFEVIRNRLHGAEREEVLIRRKVRGIGNAIHLAIQLGQHSMLKRIMGLPCTQELLQQDNTEFEPLNGLKPIHLAAALGDVAAIDFIRRAYPDLLFQKTQNNQNLFHIAAHFGQPQVIQHVFDMVPYGARSELLTAKDIDGKTPDDLCSSMFTKQVLAGLLDIEALQGDRNLKVQITMPHTLVIQGGGPRGLAYVGVLEELERNHLLEDLRSVAGTSAGAITATFIALGFDNEEIRRITIETNLNKFLDAPDGKRELLELFQAEGILQKFSKISHLLFKLNHQEKRNLSSFLTDEAYLCEGRVFRDWIDNQIYTKTEVRNCTFGEFAAMRVEKGFKHLHVFGSQVSGDVPRIRHFSSENPADRDIIIADAVRISMSIPLVFQPHPIRYKRGLEIICSAERYVDGGLVYNFPIDGFDNLGYIKGNPFQGEGPETSGRVFNRHVLGLSLYTPQQEDVAQQEGWFQQRIASIKRRVQDSYQRSLLGNLSSIGSFFFNAEKIAQSVQGNDPRVINISDCGVGLLDFDMSEPKKQELIHSGVTATRAYIEASSLKARSLSTYEKTFKARRKERLAFSLIPPQSELTLKIRSLTITLQNLGQEHLSPNFGAFQQMLIHGGVITAARNGSHEQLPLADYSFRGLVTTAMNGLRELDVLAVRRVVRQYSDTVAEEDLNIMGARIQLLWEGVHSIGVDPAAHNVLGQLFGVFEERVSKKRAICSEEQNLQSQEKMQQSEAARQQESIRFEADNQGLIQERNREVQLREEAEVRERLAQETASQLRRDRDRFQVQLERHAARVNQRQAPETIEAFICRSRLSGFLKSEEWRKVFDKNREEASRSIYDIFTGKIASIVGLPLPFKHASNAFTPSGSVSKERTEELIDKFINYQRKNYKALVKSRALSLINQKAITKENFYPLMDHIIDRGALRENVLMHLTTKGFYISILDEGSWGDVEYHGFFNRAPRLNGITYEETLLQIFSESLRHAICVNMLKAFQI